MQIAFALTTSIGCELMVCHFIYDNRDAEMFQFFTMGEMKDWFSVPFTPPDSYSEWDLCQTQEQYELYQRDMKEEYDKKAEFRKSSFHYFGKEFPVGTMDFKMFPVEHPQAAFSFSVKDSRVEVTPHEASVIQALLIGKGWTEFDSETFCK